MNKLSASLLTAALAAAPIIGFAAPAVAGSDKVDICHATSAANGKYTLISVDKDSINNPNGHGLHERDIIPAFSWVDKDRVRQYFDGLNTDKLDLLATGCADPVTPPTPTDAQINPPVYLPASCARPELPYGQVVVPVADGEGIVGHTPPALNAANTQWSTQYTLATDTAEIDWSWPAGQTGLFTFDVVPLTADPNYVIDSKTGVGQCELPETGALMDALPWGAGAVGVGLLAFAASKLRRRTAQ